MVAMNFPYLVVALSLIGVQIVIAQDDEVNNVNQNTGQNFEVIYDVDDIQEQRIGALEEENSLLRAELDDIKVLLSSLSGDVQNYSHTAFLAAPSEFNFFPPATDPLVFDLPIINPGSHYNPESGIYTVPLDGIYQFVLHYQNNYDLSSGAYLKVDNADVAFLKNNDGSEYNQEAEMTLLLSLTAGQVVWISPAGLDGIIGTETDGTLNSWFSGHLVYAL